jgi:23S rRNA pseudouridine1911/1915/1917 synthase
VIPSDDEPAADEPADAEPADDELVRNEPAVAEPFVLVVQAAEAGSRLDAFLARSLPKYSRVQLRKVIGAGGVRVNEQGTKVAHRLSAGDRVVVVLPPMNTAGPHPENIPLDILYEDDAIIAVNKPPGMVVHPARGHWSGTLASALSFHFQQLSRVGGETRPGIVPHGSRRTAPPASPRSEPW